MRFTVRLTEKRYEAKWWLEDSANRVFRFELDENTVTAWRLAIRKLPGDLIPDKQSFLDCQFWYDLSNPEDRAEAILERVAFCKLLLALGRERGTNFPALEIVKNHSEITGLAHKFPYSLLFLDNETLGDELSDEEESNKWKLALEQKYQSNPSDNSWVVDLVNHYDVLMEMAYLSKRQNREKAALIGRNYAIIVRCVLDFLETKHSFTRPAHLIYWHALLAENETVPAHERISSLHSILEQNESANEKEHLLTSVLQELIENNDSIIRSFIHLISKYYLDRYEVDKALFFWQEVHKKDWLSRAFLPIYARPWIFLITIATLVFSSLLLNFTTALIVSSLLLVFLFAFFSIMLATIFTQLLARKNSAFLALFLPRLFGSIVVGLSVLASQDTVWEITLKMAWGDWIIITIATYFCYFIFVLWDRLKDNKTSQQLHVPFRIFLISVLEAFGLTTLVTSLVPINALGEAFENLSSNITLIWKNVQIEFLPEKILVYHFFLGNTNFLALTYFPKLIVLWSGLALLIGAFVQLLWQDRHITAS